MKKLLAMLLALLCLSALPALAETAITGGWTPSEDPAVTDDVRAVFEKALEGLLGAEYTPVAYLGSQVVAGTNHCVLAQATAVVPDAAPHYVLVYFYEDLEGNAELLNVADFDIGQWCEY